MNEPQAVPIPEFERLTWETICRRYPDEWVMMGDLDYVKADEFVFRTARLLCHSKKREEVFRQTKRMATQFTTFRCRFTGKLEVPISLAFLR